MLEQDLVQQGNNLLLFGMGTVFVFLSLLVLSTSLMSAFINKFLPEEEKPTKLPAKSVGRKPDSVKPEVLAAIQLAIKEHRTKQQQ